MDWSIVYYIKTYSLQEDLSNHIIYNMPSLVSIYILTRKCRETIRKGWLNLKDINPSNPLTWLFVKNNLHWTIFNIFNLTSLVYSIRYHSDRHPYKSIPQTNEINKNVIIGLWGQQQGALTSTTCFWSAQSHKWDQDISLTTSGTWMS